MVGQESTTIQCTANDLRQSAKLQALYIAQQEPALAEPVDLPTDHIVGSLSNDDGNENVS